MPASDEPDRERAKDSDGRKQKATPQNSKSKDLSHVPCKFFKVGGCTAGPSCPFSHTLAEPGQKEHCAWFIKGNCKFGHKCALAHILPGQDLSMDRKNKKAAQQAAAAAGLHGGSKDRKPSKRDPAAPPNKNPSSLLAGGSTAPTRVLNTPSGRPPMSLPLKASISPSAPAPPLNDTDFSSFASFDEIAPRESSENAAARPSSPSPSPLPLSAPRGAAVPPTDFGPIGSPPNARSPMAEQPRSPTRLNGNSATFPPGTSPRTPSHINGINDAGILSSSPFSAPGAQSSFYPSSYGASLGHAGGVAASLGSGLAMMGGRKGWGDHDAASQHKNSALSASVTRDITFEYDEYVGGVRNPRRSMVVNEDEMEDFIPGSLTDLLTPEERSRRMSRSNSGQPPVGLTSAANTLKTEALDLTPGGSSGGMGHRHSRSVPAPSLLGDLKSIWADTSAPPLPSSPSNNSHQQLHPTRHRGTPSTPGLAARFDGLGLGGDDMSFGSPSSIGMMSPSNASAAFLPGFHQQYLAAKAKQQQAAQQQQLGNQPQQQSSGLGGRGLRNAGNTAYPLPATGGNSIANNYMGSGSVGAAGGLPSSMNNGSTLHTHVHGNTAHTYRTTPSPFDLTQNMMRPIRGVGSNNGAYGMMNELGGGNGGNGGGINGGIDGDLLLGVPHVLSPGTTRALQSHAPGQSLPQGLAAGLSRIHALPPLANMVSPPGSATFMAGGASPGASAGLASNAAAGGSSLYGGGEWSMQNQQQKLQQQQQQRQHQGGPPGLPELPGKLSYSAAAAATSRAGTATPLVLPGTTRNVNVPAAGYGGGARGAHDDDELFSMDG